MSHIISLKVTKFQQHLLITLGVGDEKPEGAKKPPPPEDRVKTTIFAALFIAISGIDKTTANKMNSSTKKSCVQ